MGVVVKSDFNDYLRFHSRSTIDKALNTLMGLVLGVGLDGKINAAEKGLFNAWLNENIQLRDNHPYSELIPLILKSIEDDALDQEEREDIAWLCDKLISQDYYDRITAEIQVLHGILGGAAADGEVTKEELLALRQWLSEHEHLRSCYPYDEVDSLLYTILKDGVVDENENRFLQGFFSEFLSIKDSKTITSPVMAIEQTMGGVCVVCPEIVFQNSLFCFTGASIKYTRSQLAEFVRSLGGKTSPSVTKHINYLVIGAEGNPCWTYSCYGRKVERAVELRKGGSKLLILHEYDFHDAIADAIG
jgi:hypothetical protein